MNTSHAEKIFICSFNLYPSFASGQILHVVRLTEVP
jgi:hypothetical protein